MSPSPLLSDNLSQQEKLRLARGAGEGSGPFPLEVLVSLATDPDTEIRRSAQQTLDSLSEARCAEWLSDPQLEEPVSRYFLEPAHVRPALLPILLTNPAAPEEAITALAAAAGPEIVPALLDNLDLLKTPALLALKDNPTYLIWQKEPPPQGYVLEADLLDLLIQEMEAERLQPPAEKPLEEAAEAEAAADKPAEGMVRKIAKMTVAQRVKLALLGNREERSLLIRDGSKVVARAVLSSPKLTDSEVEAFAAMKNVSQEILRNISMNRKFMKNYTVVKNLVNNPRLPIDVGLTLLPRLIVNDMRIVSNSKEVPDTVRKMALKLFKTRQP